MHKILFVCHANCSRSPMAEYLFKQLVAQNGESDQFEVASAAATDVAIGEPVDVRAEKLLRARGIDCSAKRARQLTHEDYAYYDAIFVMDESNKRNVLQLLDGDPQDKLHLLLDYTARSGQNIADPWEHGDYQAAFDDIVEGIQGVLEHFTK